MRGTAISPDSQPPVAHKATLLTGALSPQVRLILIKFLTEEDSLFHPEKEENKLKGLKTLNDTQ